MKAYRCRAWLRRLEMVGVVAIIGRVAGLSVPNVIGRGEAAKVDLTKANMGKIVQQLDLYKFNNGSYPTSEEGLNGLWSALIQPANGLMAATCRKSPWMPGTTITFTSAPGLKGRSICCPWAPMVLRAVKAPTRTSIGATFSKMRLPRTLQSGLTLLEIMVPLELIALLTPLVHRHGNWTPDHQQRELWPARC